jgi:hypothetical protein
MISCGSINFWGKVDKSDEDSTTLEVFSKEHVLRAWAKVGVVPMTRACLKDPNVCHEITMVMVKQRLWIHWLKTMLPGEGEF